jgi:hypothetical protein
MSTIREKFQRTVARLYAGDLGVNQSAEVAGLVGAAVAITAGIAAKGADVGAAVATFFTDKLQ